MTCPRCGGMLHKGVLTKNGYHWHCYQKEKPTWPTVPAVKAS